jgi:hypothetical protein
MMDKPGVIHQGVLEQVCAELPHPKRTGFWAALRALDHQYEFPDSGTDIEAGDRRLTDNDSAFKGPYLVPDCWYVTHNDPFPGQATIHAVEIEEGYNITNHRLKKYAYLWFAIDNTNYLNLRLHTYDRYARKNPERGLLEWFQHFERRDALKLEQERKHRWNEMRE